MTLHFGNIGPVMASYHLSQSLIQATPPSSSPLLQLPHFTSKLIEAVEGAAARRHLSVQEFMAIPAAERKRKVVGTGLLTEPQYQQAVTIAQQLPYLQVEKAFFKVQGERFVTPNSLVQFIVKARIIPPGSINVPPVNEKDLEAVDKVEKRSDAAEEDKRVPPPLAHAPYFARDHSPRWHVFLGDSKQGKIAVPPFTFSTFDNPPFTEDGEPTYNMQTLTMTFGAPPQAGRYTFLMNLVCDSYLGLDTKMNVTMEVEDATKAEDIEDDGEISEPDEGKYI
jgi:translocation protein SEC63